MKAKTSVLVLGDDVTPLFEIYVALLEKGHRLVDSLAGVALCRKFIDRAQRLTQAGQKSAVECKGKSQPNWNFNKINLSMETLA